MFIVELLSIALFGLVVGSFISALTWRLPKNISIAKGRSICPKCKKMIVWYDNIPLFSYIMLLGKCRKCGKTISPRYPIIEFLTALVFALIYMEFLGCKVNISQSPICFINNHFGFWTLPYFLFISSILIAIFIVDLEHQYIYDWMVFAIFVLATIPIIWINPDTIYSRIFSGFACASFLIFLHYITKGKGMGLGDSKLVLFGGMILDWKLSILWISGSFIIGAVVGLFLISIKKASFGKTIPFGPFIVFSFFLMLFYGENLMKLMFPYL